MIPTITLIILCSSLILATFRASAWVTERTCCEPVAALWSSVASVIVVEFLTIGGDFFIRHSALRGPPDFMVVILMPILTGTAYLLGYFGVLLFDIGSES